MKHNHERTGRDRSACKDREQDKADDRYPRRDLLVNAGRRVGASAKRWMH